VPELQRLRTDHAPAVLAFELANRAYFATFISDRGDEFFDHFTERYDALLAEQEAGTCVLHVLVGENGTVLGRFNLVDLEAGTAELGYRVAQQVAGGGVATATVQGSVGSRSRNTGCVLSERRPPMTTSCPRRCSPKPGSSQLAPPSSAAGRASGINVSPHALRRALRNSPLATVPQAGAISRRALPREESVESGLSGRDRLLRFPRSGGYRA